MTTHLKSKLLLVGLAQLSFSAAASAATTIADAAADYLTAPGGSATTAPTAAPAGWTYLYSNAASLGIEVGLTPNQLVGDTRVGQNSGFGSTGSFNSPIILGSLTGAVEYEIFGDGQINSGVVGTDLLFHPGENVGSNDYVIARYTVSAADILSGTSANISGSFRKLNDNPGFAGAITADVFLNGVSLFSAPDPGGATMLSQADGTFNINATIAEGDTISFVVGSNGSWAGDETALQAKVTVVPEPSTTGILGLAGVMLLMRRRRR